MSHVDVDALAMLLGEMIRQDAPELDDLVMADEVTFMLGDADEDGLVEVLVVRRSDGEQVGGVWLPDAMLPRHPSTG